MTAPDLLTARQMAAQIGADVKIVYNVIAYFKFPPAKELAQVKHYEPWVLEAIRAEVLRRKHKHEEAQKRKWMKTTAGRLATSFKRGCGCFLTQKQVRELCLLPNVRQMIAHTAAELQIDDNSESKTTTL